MRGGQWFRFDDEICALIDEDKALSMSPYMLFYKRATSDLMYTLETDGDNAEQVAEPARKDSRTNIAQESDIK